MASAAQSCTLHLAEHIHSLVPLLVDEVADVLGLGLANALFYPAGHKLNRSCRELVEQTMSLQQHTNGIVNPSFPLGKRAIK